jgi:hypothetical protein
MSVMSWQARQASDEVARLLQLIRRFVLELREPEQRGIAGPVVEARKRLVEQLRWRLAAVVRRAVAREVGAAV